MRSKLLLAAALSILCAPVAQAQEATPGTPCADTGAQQWSGGPEVTDAGHFMVCNGSQWVSIFSYDASGNLLPRFVNAGDCAANRTLVYDGTTGGLRCAPEDSIDPIWVTPAGVIATTNINLAISEVVAASDESGTPTYSKVSGAGWLNVATNGTISGSAPSSGGTYSVVVRATDGAGNTADRTFDVVVNSGGGPAGCANPGDICPGDLTIYVGKSPDGNVDYFTTQTNLPGNYSWNDDTNNWLDAAITNCTDVESTCRTGQFNTNQLVLADSATTTGGIDPHHAALACYCLGEEHSSRPNTVVPSECAGDPQGTNSLNGYGHDDWYLPSIAELDVMYVNLASPGDTDNPTYQDGVGGGDGVNAPNDGPAAGIFSSGRYWSSSELNAVEAWRLRFSDGLHTSRGKSHNDNVRCVRR